MYDQPFCMLMRRVQRVKNVKIVGGGNAVDVPYCCFFLIRSSSPSSFFLTFFDLQLCDPTSSYFHRFFFVWLSRSLHLSLSVMQIIDYPFVHERIPRHSVFHVINLEYNATWDVSSILRVAAPSSLSVHYAKNKLPTGSSSSIHMDLRPRVWLIFRVVSLNYR